MAVTEKWPSLAPVRSEVKGRGRALAVTEWGLATAQVSVLALDFAWPLRPGLSLVLLGALSVLTLPWLGFVLHDGAARSSFRVRLFRLALCALVLTFLGAKWSLYLTSQPVDHAGLGGTWRSYGVALLMLMPLGLLGRGLRFSKLVTLVADHPSRLMALSFAATGLLGGLLLSLPIAMQRVSELSIVDNMFMSFSAVCVTGLTVNSLSRTYTLFGEVVLCSLVQIGGLGIMVMSAAIGLLTGQRLRVKSSAVLAEIVDTESLASLRRVVLAIITSTLVIEGIGALLLYSRFHATPGLVLESDSGLRGDALAWWSAVFHAVSGFCNAGFSNLHPGLVPFVDDPIVMGSMTSLIVLGGIGFPVISELFRRAGLWFWRRRLERMSLHTRVCLRATGFLLVSVTLAYLVLEWSGSLGHLGWGERIAAALFQSASCRTAGFNVIDVGAMHAPSLMLTCVAMFIGACPGSCAGGIKATTFATLFAGLRSELQGRPPYLLDRALSATTIRKAMGVSFMSIALVSAVIFLLLLLERHPPLPLAFEAFSAFSTTGLSTGITPNLSTPGKLLILLTMYMGRIGPLTLALALSRRARALPVLVPEEKVLIG
jgi:trk system potassium uptake protein TrkH